MKHCPTCNHTYVDETLSFCLDDGTPLVSGSSPFPDLDAETLITPVLKSAARMPAAVLSNDPLPAPQSMQDGIEGATKPASRKRYFSLVVGPALLAVLLISLGAGWFMWRRESANVAESESRAEAAPINKKVVVDKAMPDWREHEVARYWLEIAPEEIAAQPTRVAASVLVLHSGQSLRFNFISRKHSFLYLIGPGEKYVPTTFLTAIPIEESGQPSNLIRAGMKVYRFPEDDEDAEHWITLDDNPGTEIYTFIFSPTPLSSPAFLNQEAGRALTKAEQKELEAFRAQYKANVSIPESTYESGIEPFVSVKVPGAQGADQPTILDVRIEHKLK